MAYNAYCSRDIYLQLKKVYRSVMTLVNIHSAPNELFSLVAMNARQYSLPHDEAVN